MYINKYKRRNQNDEAFFNIYIYIYMHRDKVHAYVLMGDRVLDVYIYRREENRQSHCTKNMREIRKMKNGIFLLQYQSEVLVIHCFTPHKDVFYNQKTFVVSFDVNTQERKNRLKCQTSHAFNDRCIYRCDIDNNT